MRSLIGLAVGVMAGLATVGGAAAQSPFYVSGSIGGYFRESDSTSAQLFQSAAPETTVDGTVRRSFDPGIIGDIALGYRLAPHIRVEAELGYFGYDTRSLSPSTAVAGFPELNGQAYKRVSGGDFSRYTGTANAFYDFSPFAGRYTPYVGAGVGVSADHQSVGRFAAADGAQFQGAGGSSTEGLALIEGGVAIALTPHLSLTPSYRYVHFFSGDEDVAHVVKVGLRYRF